MSPTDSIPIRTFYRIVWTLPPTIEDFRSHQERGVEPRVDDPEIRRLSSGVSVFRTLVQARKTAQKRPPWFGRGYIVRIEVPDDVSIRIERTTKTAGHYTIWANAEVIAGWVQAIEPVTVRKDGGH